MSIVNKVHENCTGGQGNSNTAAVSPIISGLVRADPSSFSPARKRAVKEVAGMELSDRAALRAKGSVVGQTKEKVTQAYQQLSSFCKEVEGNRPRFVTVVEVGSWEGNYT